MEDDRQCPPSDDFRVKRQYMSRGEKTICTLRYAMLKYCKLPEEVCMLCKCHHGGCPLLDECNSKLLPMWAKLYIGIPTLILLSHLLLAPFLSHGYGAAMKNKWFNAFTLTIIGSAERTASSPFFVTWLLCVEIFASFTNTLLFCILEVFEAPYFPWYGRGNTEVQWLTWVQLILNTFMLMNYYTLWWKNGFKMRYLFTANGVIDILTVHGVLYRQATYRLEPLTDYWNSYTVDAGRSFLLHARPKMNLHFLRAYRCLSAWLAAAELPYIRKWPLFRRQLIKSCLTVFAYVLTCAGTARLSEWIGHDFGWQERLSPRQEEICRAGRFATLAGKTERHEITCAPSFISFYWAFTVMSTLGIGDYTPHAGPTFALVIVMVVTGVLFLWTESYKLADALFMFSRGYSPAESKGGHVVITGSAVRDVDETVLYTFISQLLHPMVERQGCEWPYVVLLGELDDTASIRNFLDHTIDPSKKKQCQFCNADPLSAEGCNQAKVEKASMVYILPSSKSDNLQAEDEFSLHVALSVKSLSASGKSYTPFRIVMYRAHSMELALQSGMNSGQCVCLDSLGSSILAQATLVRGWPLLLTLLTTNATSQAVGAEEYLKKGLFPDAYMDAISNSLWGFALNKRYAGRPFHELAHDMYRDTGALPLCAQIDGYILTFPWNENMDPDTIVYCIHNRNPETCPLASSFCSAVDWRPHFIKQRDQALEKSLNEDLDIAAQQAGQPSRKNQPLQNYVRLPTEILSPDVLSEEEMQIQRKKAEAIKEGGKDFILVVITAVSDFWRTLALYVDKVDVDGQDDIVLRALPIIVLVPSSPPVDIADATGARDPKVQIAFVEGNWMEADVLEAAGIMKCKSVITYPTHMLRASPDNDTRTFFLLRLLNRMDMRSECNIVIELTSGMAGAHMIPVPQKMAQQGEHLFEKVPSHLQEDAFSPSCASGQVFVPGSLLGLVAKSYYVFGIVEAVEHMTLADHEHGLGDSVVGVRPEQIYMPQAMAGRPYHEIVQAFLMNRWEENYLAPTPAIVIGLLRETMYMEATLLHPKKDMRTERSDLLIVLATGAWAKWADDKGWRCIGGRAKRKHDM